jgi:predicted phage terminase large subunit-like protein
MDTGLPQAEVSRAAPEIIRPQPGPQEQFLSTPADIAIYGGAAGGGKSWALLIEPLRHVRRKGFDAMIFRRTSPELTAPGGLWPASYRVYPPMSYRGRAPVANKTDLRWTFPPYDATIRFAHMEHEDTHYNYRSSEIPLIGFDELTSFTEDQFFYMLSRNRSTCGVRPYVRAGCNPDSESWVAKLIAWWIDERTGFPIPAHAGRLRWFVRPEGVEIVWGDSREELVARYPALLPKSLTFIPAKLQDNRILMREDPEYLGNLQALPLVERERLLGGNWRIGPSAGLMFNRAWFPLVEQPPSDDQVLAKVRYWDKAGTEKDENPGSAYTVGCLMSRTFDNRFFVEDIVRGQWGALARNEVIKQTAVMDGPYTTVWIEQEPGSGGKESAEQSIRDLAGFAVHAERVTGSKEARSHPLRGQAEARNVRVVHRPWTKVFLDELHNFVPDGPGLKDQVDAASGAFNKLAAAIVVNPYDPERELLDGIPEEEYGGEL